MLQFKLYNYKWKEHLGSTGFSDQCEIISRDDRISKARTLTFSKPISSIILYKPIPNPIARSI